MSHNSIQVQIEICSNCISHQWCTRHKEASYSSLALELEKAVKTLDNSINVAIYQVGGSKMGSFEVICNGTLIFSKLSLGYFPHVPSVISRLAAFIDDYKHGRDLKKYAEAKGFSPHQTMNKSGGKSFGVSSPTKPIERSQSPVKRTRFNPAAKVEQTQPPKSKQPVNNKQEPHTEGQAKQKNKEPHAKQAENNKSEAKKQHIPAKPKEEVILAQKQTPPAHSNPADKKQHSLESTPVKHQDHQPKAPEHPGQPSHQATKQAINEPSTKKTEAKNEETPGSHSQKNEKKQEGNFILGEKKTDEHVKPDEKAHEPSNKGENTQSINKAQASAHQEPVLILEPQQEHKKQEPPSQKKDETPSGTAA